MPTIPIITEIIDVMYRRDGSVFIFNKVIGGPENIKGRVFTSCITKEKLIELLNKAEKEAAKV